MINLIINWESIFQTAGTRTPNMTIPSYTSAHFKAYLWVCSQMLCHDPLFVTPWIVAHQALLSLGFFRQEYWSGLPFTPPGDLPDPRIEPASPALQVDSFSIELPGKPFETSICQPIWGLYLAPYSHTWSLGTQALSENHSHACLKLSWMVPCLSRGWELS